jgi:hypothetical protein
MNMVNISIEYLVESVDVAGVIQLNIIWRVN